MARSVRTSPRKLVSTDYLKNPTVDSLLSSWSFSRLWGLAYSYFILFFLPSLLSPSCRLHSGLLGSRGSRRSWAQRFPGPQQVLCCPVGWLGGFGLRWVPSPRFPAPACHFLMEPCPWWKGCRLLWWLCRDPWAFLPLHGGAGWPPPLYVCARV